MISGEKMRLLNELYKNRYKFLIGASTVLSYAKDFISEVGGQKGTISTSSVFMAISRMHPMRLLCWFWKVI